MSHALPTRYQQMNANLLARGSRAPPYRPWTPILRSALAARPKNVNAHLSGSTQSLTGALMKSTTLTVRVHSAVKKRLERLAKSTGCSRSFLAAEAINAYLEINEWQVAGIKRAIASLDRGEGIAHEQVKDWVASWGSANEKPAPKKS